MRTGVRRYLNDPVVVWISLAFYMFALWQVANHWLLMKTLRLTMFEYHSISLAVEIVFAGVIVFLAVRELARKNRQLEDLDRQKEMLTQALIHDLRQPLTALLGGLDTAAGDSDLPEVTREMLEIARQGGADLLAMVNDLLDTSRLEAGHSVLRIAPTTARAVIGRGVEDLIPLAREKDIKVTLEVPEDLPTFEADAERLRRVVMNLVGNSIKFTPSQGAITVKAHSDAALQRLVVSVSDTGEGIPPEFRDRVFDKFFMVENRSHSGRRSSGLGLTFCKMVVEAHGGEIGVESMPGEGSTFTFSIPLKWGDERQ